ncbi:hypothetical protein [Ureaplasma diversum]|uniref:Uncharacterized protein n=1 Tax=Ureaplasma diversum NCTC 246 TaxID=1188241 RepID=A0A084EXH1_9BACT|nr:hypothetical protein [Ureaplasma diversum]KEZ22663.1 hypothetical protein UDIV_5500 [Ureaplasma diversum NCTC 246]
MGSNSKPNEQLNNSSTSNTTKKDSPGLKTDENKNNLANPGAKESNQTEAAKPPVTQSGNQTTNQPKTEAQTAPKSGTDNKSVDGAETAPKTDNSKATGKEAENAPKNQAQPSEPVKLEESNATAVIYGKKITKQSEKKYILQVNINDANNKWAQVILKPKDGKGSEISSTIEKIISGFVAVYFESVEAMKKYSVSAIKILENKDDQKPKVVKLSDTLKNLELEYTEEERFF